MSSLPFTKSRVDSLIKKNLSGDQIVSARVKVAMNEWLGELAANVARQMAKSPNKTLTVEEFREAVHKYELADRLAEEKERVKREIEATNKKIDHVIQGIDKSIVKKDEAESVRIVRLHADEDFGD